MMAHELSIGFVGNPNCGKTTLFNAYTGANLKVANWPGVTVEKKEGRFQYHDHEYKLVDLPGTYSLTSYTMEEQVSRQYILSDDVDVIIRCGRRFRAGTKSLPHPSAHRIGEASYFGFKYDGYCRKTGHGDRHASSA